MDSSDACADAVMSTGPVYYKTDEEGLLLHFQTILDNVDLPLMIYNVPSWIGFEISPLLVEKLDNRNPGRVAGVKFTTNDLDQFLSFLKLFGDRMSILIGADSLVFPALAMGAQGGVLGGANVLPREYSEIYSRFLQHDIDGSRSAQEKLYDFVDATSYGTFPAGLKWALKFVGLDCGDARPPLSPLSPEDKLKIERSLSWKKKARTDFPVKS